MRGAGRRKSRRLATRSLGRASEADVGATTMDLTNLVVDSAFADDELELSDTDEHEVFAGAARWCWMMVYIFTY